jgi:transcriptional regulator with XRE-family HTH domain
MTGAELKTARMRLKMTQAELAEAIGMTRTSVARMERDEQPVMRTTELAIKYLLSVESKKRGARK